MAKFKQYFYYFLFSVVFILIGWFANTAYNLPQETNPLTEIKPKPLNKYSIESLSKAEIKQSEIRITKEITKKPAFTSFEYSMDFDPTLSGNQTKKVSGLINIPEGDGKFPVVILFRGYVDPADYYTGLGTKNIGEFLAENGFITVAPDFLGYGASDKESENIFETRFQTHTTALTTLKSISSIKEWDGKNIFIWGHSNGGQIALTVLEITRADYPTVLWAPVSKPFPFSILYYTDEASDAGKFLRKKTADFENDYDSALYSLTNYLDRINAPIQVNQGTGDESVPLAWSSLLIKNLKELDKEATYITYPGANHNMTPGWSSAAENTLLHYKKFVK